MVIFAFIDIREKMLSELDFTVAECRFQWKKIHRESLLN